MNTKKLYFFNLVVRILPPSSFLSLKAKLLRWCGAKVGKNVEIFSPKILGNFDLIVGDNVFMGHDALIFGAKGSKITLENYSKVGTRSIIVTGYHEYSTKFPCIAGPGLCKDVLVREGACISTSCIILPGKIIGSKSHVAAGSVVTHDVPDMVRVAGVPAQIIKDLQE